MEEQRAIVDNIRGVVAPGAWNAIQGMVTAFARAYVQDLQRGAADEAQRLMQQFQREMVQYAGNNVRQFNSAVVRAVQDGRNAIVEYGGNALDAASESLAELLQERREMQNYDQREMTRAGRENDERQVAQRREAVSSQSARPSTSEAMEVEGIDETGGESFARASSGIGSNAPSKETPVSIPPTITYGLQETHTTVLPWVGWLSVSTESGSAYPQQLPIRMNSIQDFMKLTITDQTSGDPVNQSGGFYTRPINEYSQMAIVQVEGAGPGYDLSTSNYNFPKNLPTNAATERPQWRNYFAQMYEYYTVLGCEWEIIAQSPVKKPGCKMLCGIQYDSYSNASGETGNVMPNAAHLVDVMAFKNIQWHSIGTDEEDKLGTTIMKGHWKPGMVKRNIVNDGDVKTWTKITNGVCEIPNMNEILTLNFFSHPMNHHSNQTAPQIQTLVSSDPDIYRKYISRPCANLQIRLKYIVQFKDLRLMARYPNQVTSGQDIQLNISKTRADAGNPLANW